jgi:hypothetical protein
VTFENYKYKQYTTDPAAWWYLNTPHAFRMLSHSDQFKPGAQAATEKPQTKPSEALACAPVFLG